MSNDEPTEPTTEQPPAKRSLWKRVLFPNRNNAGWKGQVHWLATRVLFWYVVVVVILALLQRKLIYHPTRSGRLEAAKVAPRGWAHDIEAETTDGLTLHGWHFLANGKTLSSREECDQHLADAKCIVLFFHGNAGNREHRQQIARCFTDNGADVFLFDYRGYAENPGSPSEAGFHSDGRAMWDYATKTRKIPPGKIILYGGSLGGGVAVPLAAELCKEGQPPAGVMLTSTFSSLVDAGRSHYPWLPVGWVLRDRYESIDHAPDVTCPVLQLHGDRDRIVPFELGERLHAVFPESSANGVPKRWIDLPGVGHNDLPLGRLRSAFGEFLREVSP